MADPTGAHEKGQLYQLELAHLQADPNQPRKFIDPPALEDLTESVRQHGVLMPILFRQDAALEADLVVAGERRCEAARNAGLAWTAEEKTAFTTALGELKKTILALLKTKTVTPS